MTHTHTVTRMHAHTLTPTKFFLTNSCSSKPVPPVGPVNERLTGLRVQLDILNAVHFARGVAVFPFFSFFLLFLKASLSS